MPSWGTLLKCETNVRGAIATEGKAKKVTLFEKFVPNKGGQTDFLNLMGWKETEPLGHRIGALIGGIGAGKSFTGAVWAVSRALLAPECRGLITSNTFGQLSRATLVELVNVCRAYNVPLEPYRESVEDNALAIANMQRCYIGAERAFVYVLAMSSFTGKTQASRGLQIRWFLGDELAYSDEKAFLTLDGRLGRGPGKLKGQGVIVSSPNSFNWLYERFADPNRSEERDRLYKMVSCATMENVAHLGTEYVDSLRANYTEELQAQELEGQFINTAVGRVYKYFDRVRHTLQGVDAQVLAYERDRPLLISFDFNATPCVAVFAQVRGNELHVFKEEFLMDADLWELTDNITDWVKTVGHNSEIEIFGDATGASRSANSKLTSWDIVFNAFKNIGYTVGNYGLLHKRFGASNPLVINRINSVNCLFKQDRCYIDFEKCPQLVKDLEVINYSGDTIDKSDLLRSHLSDAFGYMLDTLFPYRAIAAKTGAKKQRIRGLAA